MIKSIKSNLILMIFSLIVILIIIINPKTYINSTINASIIFLNNVFPSLFPFFVFTKIINNLTPEIKVLDGVVNKVFKVNGKYGYIVALSFLSGYPIGAKLVANAYSEKRITYNDSVKLLSLCSLSGPMFIVGSIGIGVFSSIKIGYLLLLCHYIGAILNGLIYSQKSSLENASILEFKKENKSLADSMYDSIISIFLVGGFIIISSILIDILNNTKIFEKITYIICKIPFLNDKENIVNAFLNGLIEITRGIIDLSSTNASLKIQFVITSFLIAFSGVSIFMQSIAFISTIGIKKSKFFTIKFTQAISTTFVSIIISNIFL